MHAGELFPSDSAPLLPRIAQGLYEQHVRDSAMGFAAYADLISECVRLVAEAREVSAAIVDPADRTGDRIEAARTALDSRLARIPALEETCAKRKPVRRLSSKP